MTDEPFNIKAIKGLMKALGVKNVDEVVDISFDGQGL